MNDNMNFLVDALKKVPAFDNLLKSVKTGKSICVSGLSAINKANIINSLCRLKGATAFCVASDEKEAQTLCNDLCTMGLRAYVYPVRDFNFFDLQSRSHEYEHLRLKVLLKLTEKDCDVVISCIDAASQYTVPQSVLADSTLTLKEGTELSLEKAVRSLTLLGYERFDAVEGSGQFSLRGGILDFFMPDSDYPVRVEFWGDEITDLSYFDIENQRRFKKAGEIKLSPSTEIIIEDREALADKIVKKANLLRAKGSAKAKEKLYSEAELIRSSALIPNFDKFINQIYDKPETLFDYFDRDTLFFTSEFSNISDRGKAMDFQSAEVLKQGFEDGSLCRGFDKFNLTFNECVEKFSAHGTILMENFVHGSFPLKFSEIINFSAKPLASWNGSYKQLCEDLNGMFTPQIGLVILAGTQKAAKNLSDSLKNDGYNAVYTESCSAAEKGIITVMPGVLSAGFEYPSAGFFLITYGHTLYTSEKKRRKKAKNACFTLVFTPESGS